MSGIRMVALSYLPLELCAFDYFYAPEGTSGGILKSHRPSICPSVSPSIRYKSYLSDIS